MQRNTQGYTCWKPPLKMKIILTILSIYLMINTNINCQNMTKYNDIELKLYATEKVNNNFGTVQVFLNVKIPTKFTYFRMKDGRYGGFKDEIIDCYTVDAMTHETIPNTKATLLRVKSTKPYPSALIQYQVFPKQLGHLQCSITAGVSRVFHSDIISYRDDDTENFIYVLRVTIPVPSQRAVFADTLNSTLQSQRFYIVPLGHHPNTLHAVRNIQHANFTQDEDLRNLRELREEIRNKIDPAHYQVEKVLSCKQCEPLNLRNAIQLPATLRGKMLQVSVQGGNYSVRCTGDSLRGVEWFEQDIQNILAHIAVLPTPQALTQLQEIKDFALNLTNTNSITAQTISPLATSMNKILNQNNDLLNELQKTNTTNEILDSLDRLLLTATGIDETLGFEQQVRPNVAMRVENTSITGGSGVAVFASSHGEEAAALQTMLSLDRNRVQFTVHRHGAMFQINSVQSPVIGAVVDSAEPIRDLKEPVRVFFGRYPAKQPRPGSCMFWDYSQNSGDGDWSDYGCKLHAVHYNTTTFKEVDDPACHTDDPNLHTSVLDECWCYHLTHFGQLFSTGDICIPKDPILDFLSLWVSILSLICIAVVFITIALAPELLKRPGQKTKLQIILNFAILLILFVFAVVLKHLSREEKIILGVLIHYSLLSNFAWMLIAAILQYKRLVVVLKNESSKDRLKYALAGWLLPIVPPMLVLVTGNHEVYTQPPLFLPRGLAFYLSIILPLVIVMCCSIVAFTLIARNLFMKSEIRKHGDHCLSIVRFRQLVFLFLLLGLSWLFALCQLVVNEYLVLLFSYLFCICIAIQGPAFFVFFVVMDKEAAKVWRKHCSVCSWRKDEGKDNIMSLTDSTKM
ncbi:hypothetical protein B566_EDAN004504 [Ephemera danica]|nr:hypothetical protein B566_EDAN004504 [Ephemera danica]